MAPSPVQLTRLGPYDVSVLNKARPIPRRFNRRVGAPMAAVVQRRRTLRRKYARERMTRAVQRLQRRISITPRSIAIAGVLLGVSVVIAVVAVVIFSPLVTVQEIRVQRSDPRIDFEQVQNALTPLYGRRLPLLAASEVRTLLRQAIPDLNTVDVHKQYPNGLALRLSLDPVVAKLRIVDPDGATLDTGTGTDVIADYLTNHGLYVLYRPSQVGSGSALSVIDVVDWGVRPAPWSPLIDEDMLTAMRRAEVALTDQFGSVVQSRSIYLRAREFHLHLDKFAVWMDIRSPLSEQLDRLRIFLEVAGPDAAQRYVDLRIKDKVVYR